MKKLIIIAIFIITLVTTPPLVFAQGMMDSISSSATSSWPSGSPQVETQSAVSSDDHTVREEQEGKEIWEKLQAKKLECKNLTNDNFESLGEYFMGQSFGNTQSHALMNQMMKNMMGDQGETQMHITLGKRYSGCDIAAAYPQNGWGFMPMMWVGGGGNPMMGSGWGNMIGWFGIFGWLSMLIFWILLILGVVALIRYLGKSGLSRDAKTPLEILKKRYASGEINKKEFEEKKKDLS
ncbi:MAG: SHOCT domain-containing protein [Candidatus Levybacteria bacterium]|nr:SHOCT domain-containing protein [Candidatus Levybacteria bacterium]